MNKSNLKKRNQLILDLYTTGHGTSYIIDELVKAGYDPISQSAIWAVYRRSPVFIPKRKNIKFCNFCLQNKSHLELSLVKKFHQSMYGRYRICDECLEKLLPKQPIKQD